MLLQRHCKQKAGSQDKHLALLDALSPPTLTIMDSKHAVAVLIRSAEGTPLVRDPKKPEPRYWKLPGGRSEGNESPEACAVREIDEELGLKLNEDDLELLDQQDRGSHTVTFFRAHVPSLDTLKTEGNEQEEIRVVQSLIEIGKMDDLFPNHKHVVQREAVTELRDAA